MARPELYQLAPTRTDNSLNRVYQIDYAGNPALKPIRAYSLDLSLEWYYAPKSALTLAVFGKDIKDFITTQVLNEVDLGVKGYFDGSTTPVPVLYTVYAANQRRQGLRRGHRVRLPAHPANGFGVHGQYTRTWSRAYVDGQYVGELEGVSSNSGSLGVALREQRLSANVQLGLRGPVDCADTSPRWTAGRRTRQLLMGDRAGFLRVRCRASRSVFRGQEPDRLDPAHLPCQPRGMRVPAALTASSSWPGTAHGRACTAASYRRGLSDAPTRSACQLPLLMTRTWLAYALATTLTWGVWGAFAEFPTRHGFPETLVYVVWALTMIPPALYAMQRVGWRVLRDRKSILLGPR